jgi:hypothetical protein
MHQELIIRKYALITVIDRSTGNTLLEELGLDWRAELTLILHLKNKN